MGRESFKYQMLEEQRLKKKRLNPVWRGVGCFLMGLLALGGDLFSNWFLEQNYLNNWIYLPPEVYRPSFLPAWVPPGTMVSAIVALLFLVFSFGLVNFFYAVFFPVKLGGTDVPPIRRTGPRSR